MLSTPSGIGEGTGRPAEDAAVLHEFMALFEERVQSPSVGEGLRVRTRKVRYQPT